MEKVHPVLLFLVIILFCGSIVVWSEIYNRRRTRFDLRRRGGLAQLLDGYDKKDRLHLDIAVFEETELEYIWTLLVEDPIAFAEEDFMRHVRSLGHATWRHPIGRNDEMAVFTDAQRVSKNSRKNVCFRFFPLVTHPVQQRPQLVVVQ